MFCRKCGRSMGERENFCAACGTAAMTAQRRDAPFVPLETGGNPVSEDGVAAAGENTVDTGGTVSHGGGEKSTSWSDGPETPAAHDPAAHAPAAHASAADKPREPAKPPVYPRPSSPLPRSVIPKPPASMAARRPLDYGKPLVVIAAAVLLLVILINFLSPAPYTSLEGAVFAHPTQHETTVFAANHKQFSIEGHAAYRQHSLDGKTAALLVPDGEGGALYYLGGKLTPIGDDVWDFVLSLSGDGLLYAKEYSGGKADLYLSRKGGKSKLIAVDIDVYAGFCLSPDGKTVGYTLSDGEDVIGYIWDGKSRELGAGKTPLFMANGAKYIYYDESGELFVQKGWKNDNAVSLGQDWHSVQFNQDFSQIVYTIGDTSHLSTKGGGGMALPDAVSRFVTPENGGFLQRETRYGGLGATIYGFGDFAGKAYSPVDENALRRLEKNRDSQTLIPSYERYTLSANGKTLTYLQGDRVYQMDISQSKPKKTEIPDKKAVWFLSADNGDTIYYLTKDGELYRKKGSAKAVKLSEETEVDKGVGYLWGTTALFYIDDDDLMAAHGNDAQSVKDLKGDAVSVFGDGFAIYVTCQDEEDGTVYFYRSRDGKRFTLYGEERAG